MKYWVLIVAWLATGAAVIFGHADAFYLMFPAVPTIVLLIIAGDDDEQ